MDKPVFENEYEPLPTGAGLRRVLLIGKSLTGKTPCFLLKCSYNLTILF